ncbi:MULTISPECIES: undecaprenyl-phosphate glucose phosphotransferase [Pseudomonas]|uniref:Undecaprenyl-phosphate glucose phosphotransferase n=1 Tax=Pseudomonas luteola TaxID=47886 RepID=A0ABS0FLD5_PSELU|nr:MULTISPECIES: undecaprenyl-phosphate glucose phosphotransferase [Pseudomonas]MBF8641163.1 undecaprenyl-phosphate glucose phosphotransferase [Pseudomonas zeshuii]RRW49066.1 undecaprenyl-phosphate glucose phosphotransferase [Pseudomonas luteola]SHI84082.1 putative colanic acid biosysnthesis UDP-glucose lipid carrier transferase [Pseudomonas zeshuii]
MNFKERGILHSNSSAISLSHRLLDLMVISGTAYLAGSVIPGVPMKPEHWVIIFLALLIFHFLTEMNQMYLSWRGERISNELIKISTYWVLTFSTVFMVDYFFFNESFLISSTMKAWLALSLIGLCGYRVLLRSVMHSLRKAGFNTRRVAIVGADKIGQRLAHTIDRAPWMGLQLLGFYVENPLDHPELNRSEPGFSIRGNLEQLVDDARAGYIDKVYITLSMAHQEHINWLVQELSDTTASVYIIPDVFMFHLLHARSESIDGLPSISIFDTPMDGASLIVKRIEDIVLSLIILSIISIPMLVIAIGIKLSSPGPVFFRQKRYGMDGKPIEVWKFRSMKVMENGEKVTQATKNDSRITPFGSFLRRTSLDELPQFINVLRGEMSIVGPRPHAVAHNEQYRKLVQGYMLRHKVKPGITGWAQVNGWRGETDTLDKMQKRIEFDLDYIHHWSFWWDVKIIFLTLFKGFINKNAY